MADEINKIIRDIIFGDGMAHIPKMDKDYILAGRWRCDKSPTDAHHWIEDGSVAGRVFVCKYCQVGRRFPVAWGARKSQI